jgi:hypothetical protein
MARRLGVGETTIVGCLHNIWGWADKQTVDGRVDGIVSTWLDRRVYMPDFAAAMIEVGWLEELPNQAGILFPKFERHNGESAKNRASKSESQAKWRAKKAANTVDRNVESTLSTSSSTREEKRREEKNIKTQSLTLPDWLPVEPWNDYVKHRGSKFTHRAKELTLAQLGKMVESGHDPTEILQTSIANGWKGIFEPKAKGTTNGFVSQRDNERREVYEQLTGRKAGSNTYDMGGKVV